MERAQFMCNECGKDFVDDVKLGLHQYNVHTVWQNFANKRQAYPTREKPPFEFRGAEELLLLYMQVQDEFQSLLQRPQ